MEPAQIIRVLRGRRLALAVVLLAAAAVAILAGYRVTLSPPGLHAKTVASGAATAQILVDSPQSTLANLKQATLPLTTRAGVFAQYMASSETRDGIARETGIPASQITTEGPFSGAGAAQNAVTPAPARGAQILDETKPYRLQFLTQEALPLVTVYAQGPTPADAARLADGVLPAVQQQLAKLAVDANLLPADRVIVRSLGPADSGTVGGSAGKAIMVLAFLVVAVLGILVILAIDAARRRRTDEQRTQVASLNGHARVTEEELADALAPEPGTPVGPAG
jgi:hypothetical protein